MNESLEALIALSKCGTMAAAANELRVTPSAVSKRIAHLEELAGYAVIEKDGRLVRLTPAGLKLVERVQPLLSDLRLALDDRPETASGELSIGVSESILSSWGAKLLTTATRKVPGLQLRIGAHRSPVVAQRVVAGEYAIGLCAGASPRQPDLVAEHLGEEPLVLVPSGLKPFSFRPGKAIDVVTIEPHAATWDSIKPQLRRLESERGYQIRAKHTVQSFNAVVQMAKAGFAHGLAPRGVAIALGVPAANQIAVPSPGLTRSISLIGRPSTLARALVRNFLEAIRHTTAF